MTPIQEVLYGDLRRASHVWRYSAQPVIRRENVAEHSFWTALIAVTIAVEIGREDLSQEVALRGIMHDLEETGTGDLVRDMKYFDSETREAIAKVEAVFANRLFDKFGEKGEYLRSIWQQAKGSSLPGQIVALADLLCVLAYCFQERLFGNRALQRIEDECKALITEKFDTHEILWSIAREAISATR